MSEKRFRCVDNDVQFSMVEDGELILANPSYVINLLNSLAEEMDEWKTFAEQCSNECNVLQSQNQVLSDELNILKRLTLVDTARRFLNE